MNVDPEIAGKRNANEGDALARLKTLRQNLRDFVQYPERFANTCPTSTDLPSPTSWDEGDRNEDPSEDYFRAGDDYYNNLTGVEWQTELDIAENEGFNCVELSDDIDYDAYLEEVEWEIDQCVKYCSQDNSEADLHLEFISGVRRFLLTIGSAIRVKMIL